MTLTPREAKRRIQCALAEVGYGHVPVELRPAADGVGARLVVPVGAIPPDVMWRASRLAAPGTVGCYSCWLPRFHPAMRTPLDTKHSMACAAGDCQSGPDAPRAPSPGATL